MAEITRHCHKCGAKLIPGADFCAVCGAPGFSSETTQRSLMRLILRLNWSQRRHRFILVRCGKFVPSSHNAYRNLTTRSAAWDGALVGFTSAKGEPLKIQRGKGRNLEALSMTNGQFVKFDYDSRNRVIKAHDSQGHTVRYTYDLVGRLVQVQTAKSTRRHSYEGTYLESVHENDQRLFRLQYKRGRAAELLLANGQAYKFRYDYDLADNYTVIRAYVTGPGSHEIRHRPGIVSPCLSRMKKFLGN